MDLDLIKKSQAKKVFKLAFMAAVLMLAGCAPTSYDSGPYYPPYDSGYYRPGYYDDDRYDRWRERREWEEHERREHDRERSDHDRDRDRYHDRDREPMKPPPPPPPPPREELRCPPGTHESTHRCTAEERKRGCKDYGGPAGRGCSNF